MLQKLRRAMVDPDLSLLADLVEVDERDIQYRRKTIPSPADKAGAPSVKSTSSARSSFRPRAP